MFKIEKGKRGGFQYSLLSSNGRTLYSTKTFTQKHSMWKNIVSTMKVIKGKATMKIADHSTQEVVNYTIDNKGKKKIV